MKAKAILGSLLLYLTGCAMKAPEASAPEAPAGEAPPTGGVGASEASAQPATLAEAEALLERARADFDRAARNEADGAPIVAAAPSPAPPPAATRAEPERSSEKAAESDAAERPAKKDSGCETACRAFSSLERASEAVCRLDTETPAQRCARAKQIKEDAARRVSACACR